MRLDFYTYDARKCGQGAKRRARTLCERTGIQKPNEILAISLESEAKKNT